MLNQAGLVPSSHRGTILSVNLPIYVRLGKRTSDRFSLNLNTYRNAHFHTLNKAKDLFEKIVSKRIGHLPIMVKADLTYRLFFGSKRWIDISNICCIVDKFFCDTLVNQKKLIDDNMDVISNVTYQWGGVDPHDPRIEVTLSNIQTIEEPMQIILNQREVEDAIRDAVLQQITLREDQEIGVHFEGVKDGNLTVSVVIRKAEDEVTIPKKMRTKKPIQVEESIPEPAKAHTVPEEMGSLTHPIFAQPGDPATQVAAAVPRIFPDINTSAPVQTGPVATASKSLFSNLTKPVHDQKPE